MLQTCLTLSAKALLFLIGAQLGIAAYFLLPAYVEYARDTQHLGVSLHHILIGDRFTNVGAAFCVLYPVPVLCSLGSAHAIRPFGDTVSNSLYPTYPAIISPTAASPPCGCLADALVGHHIFFGQLGFSITPTERTIEFLASFSLSSDVSRFAHDGTAPEEGSLGYAEAVAMLNRVDAALGAAHRAVVGVVTNVNFAVARARFVHHAAFSGLRIADFVHNVVPSSPVSATDPTLRRIIEHVVLVTAASAEPITTATTTAVHALNTLLDALVVDTLDTLLRTHTSFVDHRQAITHCATTTTSTSVVCLAVEMVLHSVSMVESMRDELVSLKETVKRCTLDEALELLSYSESYVVGWRTQASD